MIQEEFHKCDEMPNVRITRMKVDGEWLEWMLHAYATVREATMSAGFRNSKYCPYCGKELK